MTGNNVRACKPLLRYFTLMLTNGATISMPIATKGAHTRVAVKVSGAAVVAHSPVCSLLACAGAAIALTS